MKNTYEDIVENLSVLICCFLPGDATITMVNRAYCAYFAKSAEELIGRSFLELVPEEDHERVKRHFGSLTRENPETTYTHSVNSPEGKRWHRWTDKAVFDTGGKVVEYVSMGEDITEEIKAKNALRLSEERDHSIFETTGTAIIIREEDSVIGLVNTEFEKLSGYKKWEVEGKKSWREFIHCDDIEMLELVNAVSMETPLFAPREVEFRLVTRKGQVRTVLARSRRIIGTRQIVTSLVDITRRKQWGEELKKSEEKYRQVVENANELIAVVQDKVVRFMNRKARHLTGTIAESAVDRPFVDFIHPDDRAMVNDYHIRRISGEDLPHVYPFRIVNAEGETTWMEINAVFVEWEGRPATLNFLTDITERRKADDELRKREKRYREILEQIDDGYYEVDLKGSFTFFNESMCRMLMYTPEELMGMNYREFTDKPNAQRVFPTFNHVYRTGEPTKTLDWELTRKDGQRFFVETSVSVMRDPRGDAMGFRGISRDVTEQRRLEHQLCHLQKMESIGTLAGGIAHDFNNILTGIIGNAELALTDDQRGRTPRDELQLILQAGSRAKDLVKQILTFSRRGECERRPIRPAAVVEDALKMLRASLPSTIEMCTNIEAGDDIIEADPSQVHQIVVNLCTNAYHAVRGGTGTIEVSLKATDVDSPPEVCSLKPGRYVEIAVSDTGCGMTPEIMERIFDPYFTTKPTGEGTGLGLAIVHGIVKGLGGAITVRSTPGNGSTFRVYLPCMTTSRLPEPAEKADTLPSGSERVLLVDDETTIADMHKKMLERLGYTVTTQTSSFDALDLFEERPDRFDLVVSDLTMPRMDGDQLAERLHRIRPDIPIIICTGYSDFLSPDVMCVSGIRNVMNKPILMKDLAKTIRAVLDSVSGPQG
ncbi:MAG TPA: PAS domain S-box protein [Deltaproteobacteria bacterium]|nr:PAS domain S-box protein [Deltaproteobacteria bacterium]